MSDESDYDYSDLADSAYREWKAEEYQDELDKTKAKLRWLVDHSVAAGSISKAKAAELLGIPLIDYVNENFPEEK